MKRVFRIDAGGELARPEKLSTGWLRVEGRTARVGILEYDGESGLPRRELVLAEDLFDAASLASARMVPVTNQHPDRLLDDATARAHQVGSVGEMLRADGDYLVAPLMVTDAATVAAIEAGRQELSWGYEADLDETPGVDPKFGPYDARQKNRRINHLAIVDRARAGSGARIRLDSDGNARAPFGGSAGPMIDHKGTQPAPAVTEKPAMKIRVRKHHFDASEANAPVLQDAVDRELAETDARADAADKAKITAEQQRADAVAKLDGYAKRVKSVHAKLRARLDAFKARMMGCDECAGTGKVMDAETEKTCEYCGGTGKVRMHDEIKAMSGADDALPDDDVAEMDDDLSGEPASEEAQEKAANPAHEDPKGEKKDAARRQRKIDCAAARKKKLDSLARIADRRAIKRAQLLTEAAAHVDAAEIGKKSDDEIRRIVLVKIAPHVDAAKMDAASVGVLYAAEVARAKASQQSPSEAMLQSVIPTGGPRLDASAAAAKKKAHDDAVASANKSLYA